MHGSAAVGVGNTYTQLLYTLQLRWKWN